MRVGAILMVIGVALFIAAVFPLTRTDTSLNESHTIDGYYFFTVSWVFTATQQIHITFTVSGGPVDFWVMDENEFNHFKNGEGFNYYTSPSSPSVSSTKIDWVPPVNERIHFVWDNPDSTPKVVSMVFSSDYMTPLFPDWVRFIIGGFGGILFVAGLSRVLRRTQKPKTSPAMPVPPPPVPVTISEGNKFCRYC